jgi:glycine/sarcosine N-methyltransferase
MDMYDLIADRYSEIFPLEPAKVDFLETLLGGTTGRFLDVGCATGDLGLALARSGREVVGIDLNPRMVELARRRVPAAGGVRFLALDMVQMASLGAFDAIACLGNTLPHLSNEAQVGVFFDIVWDQLSSGGVFVFQLLNYDKILADRAVTFPVVDLPDFVFRRRYEFLDDGRIAFHVDVEDRASGDHHSDQTLLRPLTEATLRGLLAASGFECIEVLGNFSRAPHRPSDFAVVYVVRKR